MSDAFHCDRCGEYVPGDPDRVVVMTNPRHSGRRQQADSARRWDLCSSCKHEAINFFRGAMDADGWICPNCEETYDNPTAARGTSDGEKCMLCWDDYV